MATSTGLVAAGPANADTHGDSEALGKFLGGSAVDLNLDDIAQIAGAQAPTENGELFHQNPLGVELLNVVGVDLGSGISVDLFGTDGVIDLGAVNQVASVQEDDVFAATGAVSDSGAIDLGVADQFPSNAAVDLTALLSQLNLAGLTDGLVSDVSLELGAISSSIREIADGEVERDYGIASADLTLESPALGRVYSELGDALSAVEAETQGLLDALVGESGVLDALTSALTPEESGLLSVDPSLSLTAPSLSALLPDDPVGGEAQGITVDLNTGLINVDLEAVLDDPSNDLPSLNALPANYEVLNADVIDAISEGVMTTVTAIVTDLVEDIEDEIGNTGVDLEISVELLSGLNVTPGLGVCNLPVFGAICDLLDDLTNAIGDLIGLSLMISLDATVAQIQSGDASLSIGVPGEDSTVLEDVLSLVLTSLGLDDEGDLDNAVFGVLGGVLNGVFDIVDELQTLDTLVADIVGGLNETIVGPLLDNVVTELVSLTANVQPETGDLGEGSETVRALQLSLLPSSPLAEVNLASSTIIPADDDEDPVFETSISADPSEVEQGESTLITGEGFAPGETVQVSIPGEEPVETTADEDGNISVSLPVPADYELGETEVTAVGEVSETPATTAITVIEPDDEGDPTGDPEGDPTGDPEGDPTGDPEGDPTGDPEGDP
ncbi:choice-of-anchor G family protein, partial [Nesterenkonia muleiensis]|uniref:choice-of-anchor G family protein n=1 Tax=Nesterenkonia muleiensis TaxID=2282648 RepID=UPI00138FE9A7